MEENEKEIGIISLRFTREGGKIGAEITCNLKATPKEMIVILQKLPNEVLDIQTKLTIDLLQILTSQMKGGQENDSTSPVQEIN